MRTKVTLALLFLNVALFFFIFKFEQPWQVEQRTQQTSANVLGPEVVNIQTIRITGKDPASAVNLVRRADGWYLTEPFEWPASKNAVNSITSGLQLMRREASFEVRSLAEHNMTLASYGLDPAAITATFTSSDPSLPREREAAGTRSFTIKLGSRTQDGNSLYLLSPNGEYVYVVDRSIADSLSQSAADLRLNTLFTIADFEARSLAVAPTGVASTRLQRESDDRWQFESPVTARADRNETRRLINELGALTAKDFVTEAPADVTNGPVTRISLGGNGRSETLLLYGLPGGAATAARDVEYLGRMESKSTFFKVAVPVTLKAELDSVQTALRDRHVLDFDSRNVTKISISGGNRALELQRLEPATPADLPSWRLVPTDANAANQSITADSAVVNRLLAELTRLTAKEFTSDAPTPRERESAGFNVPERTVDLVVSPSGPAVARPTTIQFSIGLDAPRAHAFVHIPPPAEAIYEVDPAILDELPLEPVRYRDRLVRALPASVQISTLRLTDLQENKTLLELPSPAATANAAVATLLAQLRTIRARQFVPDEFSESENTAEKRPWRYRMEMTTTPTVAGAQPDSLVIFFGERSGGTTQYAGSRAINLVWLLEQPLTDALAPFIYPRDPGPTAPKPE